MVPNNIISVFINKKNPMNIQKLKHKFLSGKNSKPWYYIKEYARLYTPACILIWRGAAFT